MKRPAIFLVVLGGLAATLAFSLTGCENPANDVAPAKVSPPVPVTTPSTTKSAPSASTAAPSASTSAAKTPATSSLPKDAEPLAITAGSSKIEFVGSKVTGSHTGGFKSFEGTWSLVSAKPEESRIVAEIAMDSTFTDTERLTGHLKSPDFFDVAKFPKSSFETTGIAKGNTDTKAKDATHTVTGNLTLHGVTKSVQFPAKVSVTPQAATLESEFFLNRKDFGIVYPGMANDLIRDEVVIKLVLQASRKS